MYSIFVSAKNTPELLSILHLYDTPEKEAAKLEKLLQNSGMDTYSSKRFAEVSEGKIKAYSKLDKITKEHEKFHQQLEELVGKRSDLRMVVEENAAEAVSIYRASKYSRKNSKIPLNQKIREYRAYEKEYIDNSLDNSAELAYDGYYYSLFGLMLHILKKHENENIMVNAVKRADKEGFYAAKNYLLKFADKKIKEKYKDIKDPCSIAFLTYCAEGKAEEIFKDFRSEITSDESQKNIMEKCIAHITNILKIKDLKLPFPKIIFDKDKLESEIGSQLQTALQAEENRLIGYHPEKNIQYLGDIRNLQEILTLIPEEAAHFVQNASNPKPNPKELYEIAIIEAIGYLNSKILYPNRKFNIKTFDTGPGRIYALLHKITEKKEEQNILLVKELKSKKNNIQSDTAHLLGYHLGESLYKAYEQGKIDNKKVKKLTTLGQKTRFKQLYFKLIDDFDKLQDDKDELKKLEEEIKIILSN